MNMKNIAAALALSLTVATANTQAAEFSADLSAHVQQVIAEIHVGNTDWAQMVGRIDRLVAHIDEQVLEGTGDYDELRASRERLVRARAQIQKQYLTAANAGETAIGPAPAAACEVCGMVHSAPVATPAPLSVGTTGVVDGGYSSFGSAGGSFSSGGAVGGGGVTGGGIGGFGGIGLLGGIAAAIVAATDDDDNFIGIPASPAN